MLNGDQLNEAIEQMKVHCDLAMPEYSPVCARGVLNDLGYGADVEQVLQHIFDGGFTYCLDPHYHKSPSNDLGPVSGDVCYWGPDQLKSRLECVR